MSLPGGVHYVLHYLTCASIKLVLLGIMVTHSTCIMESNFINTTFKVSMQVYTLRWDKYVMLLVILILYIFRIINHK